MGIRTAPLALCLTIALSGACSTVLATDIIIGTGASERVHYSVARAICRQIERSDKDSTCEVDRIEGGDAAEPVAVLFKLTSGAIEIGLVESDWQYHAFQKSGPAQYIDISFANLRSLFSLHAEPFTLIARRDSGIDSLDDLVGKRVNIGNPASSQRVIMEMIMEAKGWTKATFQLADELTEAEQSLALCHNRVQAIVSTAPHPDPGIAQAIKLCDAVLVEVSGAAIDKLIASNRFFSSTEIPAGTYKGMAGGVKTFGIKVTAVTAEETDADTVHAVVESVFENLDDIKRLHTALRNLLPGRMMTDGLSAPMHEGARRYFQSKGMM